MSQVDRILRDGAGRVIGRQYTGYDGVVTTTDGAGTPVARYDPKTDITSQAGGPPVGYGDVSAMLIPQNQYGDPEIPAVPQVHDPPPTARTEPAPEPPVRRRPWPCEPIYDEPEY